MYVNHMDTLRKRFFGLMFNSTVLVEGYLLKNCRSIHTCFMKQTINVFGLNEQFQIIEYKKELKPWQFVFFSKKVKHVLETGINIECSAIFKIYEDRRGYEEN